MKKKVPFKKWSKSEKTALYFTLGCAAFCAVMTAFHAKQKDVKYAVFQGICTVAASASTAKIINDARNCEKQKN